MTVSTLHFGCDATPSNHMPRRIFDALYQYIQDDCYDIVCFGQLEVDIIDSNRLSCRMLDVYSDYNASDDIPMSYVEMLPATWIDVFHAQPRNSISVRTYIYVDYTTHRVLARSSHGYAIIDFDRLSAVDALYNGHTCKAYGFDFPSIKGQATVLTEAIRYGVIVDSISGIKETSDSIYDVYMYHGGVLYKGMTAHLESTFVSDITGYRFPISYKRELDGYAYADVPCDASHSTTCEVCGKSTFSKNGDRVCRECREKYQAVECPVCGEMTYSPAGYHDYCITKICSYHASHCIERTFNVTSNSEFTFTVGFENELEFDSYKSLEGYIKECRLTFGELFHFEHDGSLNCYGVECVSEVFDIEFLRQHSIIEKYIAIVRKWGGHATDNCGFHVHIGRRYFAESRDELNTIIISNRLDMYNALTRGTRRNCTDYCSRIRSVDDDIECLRSHGRSMTVDEVTIEFRHFRAQTSARGIYRILYACRGIAQIAESITTADAERLTGQELINCLPESPEKDALTWLYARRW